MYSQSAEDPDGLLGEEMVFWCLFAIMQSLDWRKYFISNSPDLKKLQDSFVSHFKSAQPTLYQAMVDELGIEEIAECLLISMPDRFFLPIFNCEFPVEVSKHIFDLFVWEQTGVDSLLRVFFRCLEHQSAQLK